MPSAAKASTGLEKLCRNALAEVVLAQDWDTLRAPGAYEIHELGPGRCRFATTPHDARSHRFCGAATEIGPGNIHGSWCPEHLPHVLSSGGAGWKSRAEVAAKNSEDAA